MQHPAAEYYNSSTFIAYQWPHEDPYICANNHSTGEWSGPFQADVNPMNATPDTTASDKVENHGRPAIIVDS